MDSDGFSNKDLRALPIRVNSKRRENHNRAADSFHVFVQKVSQFVDKCKRLGVVIAANDLGA